MSCNSLEGNAISFVPKALAFFSEGFVRGWSEKLEREFFRGIQRCDVEGNSTLGFVPFAQNEYKYELGGKNERAKERVVNFLWRKERIKRKRWTGNIVDLVNASSRKRKKYLKTINAAMYRRYDYA